MGETDVVGAGGEEALIYPVMTKVALPGGLVFFIEADGVIRTCFDTELTTGAFFLIEDDDAVLSFLYGFHRARLHTGRIIAVAAHMDMKRKARFSACDLRTFFRDVKKFDPEVILLFTCHLTGLASPAGFVVDRQSSCAHASSLLYGFAG